MGEENVKMKEVTQVKAGYEEIHAMATDKLNKLEEEVRREVEERIAKDKETLVGIIAGCEETVLVPDEEVVEETATAETHENY